MLYHPKPTSGSGSAILPSRVSGSSSGAISRSTAASIAQADASTGRHTETELRGPWGSGFRIDRRLAVRNLLRHLIELGVGWCVSGSGDPSTCRCPKAGRVESESTCRTGSDHARSRAARDPISRSVESRTDQLLANRPSCAHGPRERRLCAHLLGLSRIEPSPPRRPCPNVHKPHLGVLIGSPAALFS